VNNTEKITVGKMLFVWKMGMKVELQIAKNKTKLRSGGQSQLKPVLCRTYTLEVQNQL
jgi:hypothetical protein